MSPRVGTVSVEDQLERIGWGRFQATALFAFILIIMADGMELVVRQRGSEKIVNRKRKRRRQRTMGCERDREMEKRGDDAEADKSEVEEARQADTHCKDRASVFLQ